MCCVFSDVTRAHKGDVSALCFSPRGDVLLAGYESGLMEIWQNNSIVGHKQVMTHTSVRSMLNICLFV